MSDKELISKILKDDKQAFRTLIDKYKKLVYRSSYHLVRNESDAEDICQEVFLEVYRSLHHLRNENDLSGWLFKIAYNKSISLLRKKNPAKANTSKANESALTAIEINSKYADRETPVRKLEQEEARKILFSAIDRLPDMQRKVLLMHKFEDYSQQQICAELDLTRAAVESLIYRAKFALRKSLNTYFKNI